VALEESAEIDADITTHTAIADAHHSKTTSFSELSDSATDAQIPDDITIQENDPQVGSNTTNYLPKWDGSALVKGTIYDDGNVGIGTTSPKSKMHVDGIDIQYDLGTGNCPSGYSEGDYDGEGNLADCKQYGMIINDGNVGIGTTSPNTLLDINGITGNDGYLLTLNNTGNSGEFLRAVNDLGNRIMGFNQNAAGDGTLVLYEKTGVTGNVLITGDGRNYINSGNVGIGTTSPSYPLEMGSGAHVTSGGVWTNASSRKYKENIQTLTIEEAITTLKGLKPTRFNYKADKTEEYLGFIAEDVPELVATKDRKGLSSMDIVAVLTKVVQEQQKKIEELEARLNERQ